MQKFNNTKITNIKQNVSQEKYCKLKVCETSASTITYVAQYATMFKCKVEPAKTIRISNNKKKQYCRT